jgi:hypothetical protein
MKILITESQYQKLMENIQVIDDILDKMNEIGYENLENNEKITLNKYSEWLNSGKKGDFMDEITPKNVDFEQKMGDKWTRTLEDGSELTFQFDYEEIEKDVDLYFGVIYWNNKQWIGCVVTEKDGSVSLLDFVEDTEEFQTYKSGDTSFEYDKSKDIYLGDSLGDLYDEVYYFFEEIVIPELVD